MKTRHVAAAALAAVGLLFAGNATASADTASFLNDVAAAGFSNNSGNQAEVVVGTAVCVELHSGLSENVVAYDLWRRSGIETLGAAQVFVEIAVADLCASEEMAT